LIVHIRNIPEEPIHTIYTSLHPQPLLYLWPALQPRPTHRSPRRQYWTSFVRVHGAGDCRVQSWCVFRARLAASSDPLPRKQLREFNAEGFGTCACPNIINVINWTVHEGYEQLL